ncbi:hypothetical protein QM327_07780 [Pantoea dispersa]|uniref:hypothetical protein n=1 Tax=Pantoea dispersa TaxID=59814 RepID=UPI0024B86D43|nr:hypothetical protein [Pantoea dispersa]MDI9766456.1 hypothetical protein [Pantoea dispersa]
MTSNEIDFQALQVAKESAKWAYYSLWITGAAAVVSVIAATATLAVAVWAALVAKKGLVVWKEQHISTAKADWIASLVNYASELSYLPYEIDYRQPSDKHYVEKVAGLLYECIKRWKVLQVHLSLNPDLQKKHSEKYDLKWADFSINFHNAYMDGQKNRDELKSACIDLYNT